MTIHSYAIARKFLILQFVNETHNKIVVYDLVKIYPSLIDQAVFQKNQTAITLYSVNNFL